MITVKSADGTAIAYDRTGEGPALIVVTGALSTRAAIGPMAEALGSNFTVYAYDRRGRGDSGDEQPYSPEREIEDLGAMIDEAGGSAFVFGHSSGAALALDAAGAGLPITKLVAYEPPFIVDAGRPGLDSSLPARMAELIDSGDRDGALECWMVNTVGETPESLSAWRGTPPWQALTAIVHTTLHDLAIMSGRMSGRPLPSGSWPGATMPVLVIDGELSPPFMHSAADAVAAALPDARRHTIEGAGHGATPEQLLPVFTEFFGDRA
ncbi:MAG TPA: alpha/beta hydrolase [Micromonosporaceae bacterium]|jgi:pimeloyl-ACP methyl ester carboxylesterase